MKLDDDDEYEKTMRKLRNLCRQIAAKRAREWGIDEDDAFAGVIEELLAHSEEHIH
jgi:hypothetical protein